MDYSEDDGPLAVGAGAHLRLRSVLPGVRAVQCPITRPAGSRACRSGMQPTARAANSVRFDGEASITAA